MAGRYDHTSMGGPERAFPATQWTRLLCVQEQEALLAELYQAYWKPIYCYLRAKGFGNEQAKDLVQGFFSEKVLGTELVERADRQRGRFRSFLLRAVHNYAISALRAEKPHRSLEGSQEYESPAGDPEREFDRAWADDLLQQVLAELESECRQRGKETHWHIFHDWLLDPQPDQTTTMGEICRRYGVSDPSQASHMIENIKRRFRTLLRSHLGQLVTCDTDVEAEIREFIGLFSAGAART